MEEVDAYRFSPALSLIRNNTVLGETYRELRSNAYQDAVIEGRSIVQAVRRQCECIKLDRSFFYETN